MAARPRVSVCIPVYRSEQWIGGAIESVLAQTFDDFEIVVVDNRSPDGTADAVRAFDDPRIRLFVNPSNLGPVVNHNRAVDLSRGELIKVLHADDRLMPTCLERMVEILDEHQNVGYVFARRRIEIDPPDHPELVWFKQRGMALHWGFRELGPVNDGRDLFAQYVAAGFPWNWVGEQTAVMARRACFERVGLFNERIWQGADAEMWARMMLAYDVGFVDQELVIYRFGHENLTMANASVKRHWIDRIWMLETLLAQEPAAAVKRDLARLRRTEYLYVGRDLVSALLARRQIGQRLRDLGAYGTYRVRRELGSEPAPVQQIAEIRA